MRSFSNWKSSASAVQPAFFSGDAYAGVYPRELRVAAIIAGAPRFPLDEIEEDLFLIAQGGLRGHVRDEELN